MIDLLSHYAAPLFEHLDLLIPTLLTIYGWKIIYLEGNRLAKRNETFNLSQIARKVLQNIDKEAETIWSHSQQILGDLDSAKLTTQLAEFELCIRQLRDHYYCDLSITNRDIYGLRRALTAYPYSINRREIKNPERIKEIKTQIGDLSLKLLGSTYENINKKFA